ncbi:hypothetical protein [Dongia sp. agr-C8]
MEGTDSEIAEEVAGWMKTKMPKLRGQPFIEQVKPYLADEETFGRFCADINDLIEACEWFLKHTNLEPGRVLSPSELQALLIDIETAFVEHAAYHINSLGSEIESALESLSEVVEDDPEEGDSGGSPRTE